MTTFINFTIYEPFLLKYAQICAGGCEHTSDQIQKKNRNLYPWPGTVSKMVLYATGLDSGVRGLEPV